MNQTPSQSDLIVNARQFVGCFFEPDPLLGWKMVPGRQGWYVKPGIRSWVRINHHGIRGKDFDLHTPPDTYRILILADSFGAAIEVDEGQTFTHVMEQYLNKNFQIGTNPPLKYQVINSGTGGYGTEQEYLFLKSRGASFEPNIVMLAFHFGDDIIENNTKLRKLIHWRLVKLPRPYLKFKIPGEFSLLNYPPKLYEIQKAWQHYYDQLTWEQCKKINPNLKVNIKKRLDRIYRRMKSALCSSINKFNKRDNIPLDLMTFAKTPDPLFEASWQHTANLLQALKQETEKLKANFIVAGLCTKEQIIPNYIEKRLRKYADRRYEFDPNYPNERLKTILQYQNIPYLDLTPIFRSRRESGEELFFKSDLHWNEFGHKLAGEHLAAFVLKSGREPQAN